MLTTLIYAISTIGGPVDLDGKKVEELFSLHPTLEINEINITDSFWNLEEKVASGYIVFESTAKCVAFKNEFMHKYPEGMVRSLKFKDKFYTFSGYCCNSTQEWISDSWFNTQDFVESLRQPSVDKRSK